MQNESISIRATKKDKKLHSRAAKVAGNKQKAVMKGIYHINFMCYLCDAPLKDGYFRSQGAPVCTDCAENTSIKLDVDNDY